MDTRKVAAEYRMAQWAQIIQTRKSTGQSIKAFCATEGISKNTYFYWQRKLREAACEMADIAVETDKTLTPIAWTQIQTSKQNDSLIVIEVSGCRIEATGDTDAELLTKICRILKTL